MFFDKEKYKLTIKFKLDSDAPSKYREHWNKLKENFEFNRGGELKNWLQYCKITSNKLLPILDRAEGGIGGNNNIKNKQIRFRGWPKPTNDDYIVFAQICDSSNGIEKWSIDELDDLILAFTKACNHYLQTNEAVHGCYEIMKK